MFVINDMHNQNGIKQKLVKLLHNSQINPAKHNLKVYLDLCLQLSLLHFPHIILYYIRGSLRQLSQDLGVSL